MALFIADQVIGGVWPLQHHQANDRKIDYDAGGILDFRTFRSAARIIDTNEFGQYEIEQDSMGDVVGSILWKHNTGVRPMPAWTFASPAVATRAAVSGGGGPAAEASYLPLFEQKSGNITADVRFQEKSAKLLHRLPKPASGSEGVILSTMNEIKEVDVFLNTDQRLIAVNAAGDPDIASLVCDLTDSNKISNTLQSRLHSVFRVVRPKKGEEGVDFNEDQPAISIQYGTAGQDGIPGYGLISEEKAPFDEGGFSGGAGTIPEFDGSPVGEILGRSPDPTESFVPEPEADPEPPHDPGSGLMHAAMGNVVGGPIDLGDEKDPHKIGETHDKRPINSAHISTDALFKRGGDDAPLEFGGNWVPPSPAPYVVPVHLRMDKGQVHTHVTGAKTGLWRWESETWVQIPPETPEPSEGDDFDIPIGPIPDFPPPGSGGDGNPTVGGDLVFTPSVLGELDDGSGLTWPTVLDDDYLQTQPTHPTVLPEDFIQTDPHPTGIATADGINRPGANVPTTGNFPPVQSPDDRPNHDTGLHSHAEIIGPSFAFKAPQLNDPNFPDIRYMRNPTTEQVNQWYDTAPLIGRMAFLSKQGGDDEYITSYTTVPSTGRNRGGTSNGTVIVLPPEADGSQQNPSGPVSTLTWVFGPGVQVGFGAADTGGDGMDGNTGGITILDDPSSPGDTIIVDNTQTTIITYPSGGGAPISTGGIHVDDNVSITLGDDDDAEIVFDGTDLNFTEGVGSFDAIFNMPIFVTPDTDEVSTFGPINDMRPISVAAALDGRATIWAGFNATVAPPASTAVIRLFNDSNIDNGSTAATISAIRSVNFITGAANTPTFTGDVHAGFFLNVIEARSGTFDPTISDLFACACASIGTEGAGTRSGTYTRLVDYYSYGAGLSGFAASATFDKVVNFYADAPSFGASTVNHAVGFFCDEFSGATDNTGIGLEGAMDIAFGFTFGITPTEKIYQNASGELTFDATTRINTNAVLNFSSAETPGSGATAAFGTIASASEQGPKTAAQSQWISIEQGGTQYWVPAWQDV